MFDNCLHTLKSNMTARLEILPPQDINVRFWFRASETYNLALYYFLTEWWCCIELLLFWNAWTTQYNIMTVSEARHLSLPCQRRVLSLLWHGLIMVWLVINNSGGLLSIKLNGNRCLVGTSESFYRYQGSLFNEVLTNSKQQYTGHKAARCDTKIVNSYTHFCRPQWEQRCCNHCDDWKKEHTRRLCEYRKLKSATASYRQPSIDSPSISPMAKVLKWTGS